MESSQKTETDQIKKPCFYYQNELFSFDINLFNKVSQYFIKQNEINSKPYINIIEEFDENTILTPDTIRDFINYFTNQNININDENAIALHQLAKKFMICALLEKTGNYISYNQENIIIKFLRANHLHLKINTTKYEELIIANLPKFFEYDELYSLPFPTLYRILNKYQLKNPNENITDIYFKCIDKYGKDASILMKDVSLIGDNEKYLRLLLSDRYSNKFDFRLAEPTHNYSIYDIQSELIKHEKANKIQQKDIQNLVLNQINKLSTEINQMREEMNKKDDEIIQLKEELGKFKDETKIELENQKIFIQNNLETKIDDLIQNQKIETDESKKNFEDQINRLKNTIQEIYFSQYFNQANRLKTFNNFSGESQAFVLFGMMKSCEDRLILNINNLLSYLCIEQQKSKKINNFSFIQIHSKGLKETIEEFERIEITYETLEMLSENSSLNSDEFFNKINCFDKIYIKMKCMKNGFWPIFRCIQNIKASKMQNLNIQIIYSGVQKTDQSFKGNKDICSLIIEENVTEIVGGGVGNGSFENCENLREVILPKTLIKISDGGFNSCSNLRYIEIPENVTTIGPGAFAECKELTEINIPPKVTSIGNVCFQNCKKLSKITINPYNLCDINSSVFNNCSIKHFVFQNSVVEVTDFHPEIYGKIEQITIPNSVTRIANKAFSDIKTLKQIQIPDSVKIIESEAFSKCESLEKVTIPKSITSIDSKTFFGCKSLKQISIPSLVKSIGENAFSNCLSLAQVDFSDNSSTKFIWNSAFSGCLFLKHFEIPPSVTSIGKDVFSGCSSLNQVTIPPSVISIGENAFSGCSSLNQVTIPPYLKTISANLFNECISLEKVTIHSSLTEIGSKAFYKCSSLSQIEIPNTVKSIGYYCFSECRSLKSIVIPSSVQAIGEYCFRGCTKMTEITMNPNAMSFYSNSFNNCPLLKHLIINETVQKIDKSKTRFYEVVNKITIPDSVTEIEPNAFSRLTSLSHVVFGPFSRLTTIGYNAFLGCSSLSRITIPQSVTSIENYTFSECTKLEQIELPPSLISIGNYAFNCCNSLKKVQIPSSVKTIGKFAFFECKSLEKVAIPQSLAMIQSYSFSGCKKLLQVSIPNSVKRIQEGSFKDCSSLKQINIPLSVVKIDKSAFSGCSSLNRITIPPSVVEIGEFCFSNCSGLTKIDINLYETKIHNNSFEKSTKIICIDTDKISDEKEQLNGLVKYFRGVGTIEVFYSSIEGGDPLSIIGVNNKLFFTENKENQWIGIEFKGHQIIPTNYTIKTYSSPLSNNHHLKSWVLEGSKDNINWTVLDKQDDSPLLNGANFIHTFPIKNNKNQSFRFLRIYQTGLNWDDAYFLVFQLIEFFGRLI